MFEIGEDWTSCYRMKLKTMSWKIWIWSWKYVFDIVGFKEQIF
jgi:hypothetical protein